MALLREKQVLQEHSFRPPEAFREEKLLLDWVRVPLQL